MLDIPRLLASSQEHLALYRIEPERDEETLLTLAASELTHNWWRNTAIEDAHAGGRIDDADMLAANVIAYRASLDALAVPEPARDGLWDLLEFVSDPERTLPGGRTVRNLMRGFGYRAYRQEARQAVGRAIDLCETLGRSGLLTVFASFSLTHPAYWYGMPWWPAVVDDFFERLDDPRSSLSRWLDERPAIPRSIIPSEHLRAILLTAPEVLPHEVREWLIRLALGYPERPVLQEWKESRQTGG